MLKSGADAVLDVVEDLAIGRPVIPHVVNQARCRGNQIVARPAFAVDAVAWRALRVDDLAGGNRSGVEATGFFTFAASGLPCAEVTIRAAQASASAAIIVRNRRESTRCAPVRKEAHSNRRCYSRATRQEARSALVSRRGSFGSASSLHRRRPARPLKRTNTRPDVQGWVCK